jgi:hypothetical protein
MDQPDGGLNMFHVQYLLPVLAVLLLSGAAAGQVVEIPAQVDPARDLGALARLYRPSVMLSWADAEAGAAFLALPGPLGAVRVTLEPLLTDSTSLADFKTRLAAGAAHLKPLVDRGATVVVTVARTPRWAAANKDESPAGQHGFNQREASPPENEGIFEQLGEEIVRALNAQNGSSLWYEFWNEPESRSFWGGSSAALFRAYDAFVRGARRADPRAKVGGLAVGSWSEPRAGETGNGPLLQAFIRQIAPGVKRGTSALDFVSWHNFSKHPEEGWAGVATVRAWLRDAGLPDLPQVVSEWNRWSTFPEWYDPARDTTEGATFLLAALPAMEAAGVTAHTIAALQDFNAMTADQAFRGDFGLVTRAPMVKKASFCAVEMLGRLAGKRVAVDLPAEVTDSEGIGALATASAEKIVLLVYRHSQDVTWVYFNTLRRAGYPRYEDTGLTKGEIEAFNGRRADLPARVNGAARQALTRARAAWERARSGFAAEVVVRPSVAGLSKSAQYRVYRLDSQNCNAGQTYRDGRGQGKSHAAALAAAQANQTLKVDQQGSGPLPELRLTTQSAVLLEIDR